MFSLEKFLFGKQAFTPLSWEFYSSWEWRPQFSPLCQLSGCSPVQSHHQRRPELRKKLVNWSIWKSKVGFSPGCSYTRGEAWRIQAKSEWRESSYWTYKVQGVTKFIVLINDGRQWKPKIAAAKLSVQVQWYDAHYCSCHVCRLYNSLLDIVNKLPWADVCEAPETEDEL